MNINEIDWRYPSVKRIFDALTESLQNVIPVFDDFESGDTFYFDLDTAYESSKGLLGIAFITAQIYITGTISDASKIDHTNIELTKRKLLRDYSDSLPGLGVTQLELCDAMANYFKHHEEWKDWSPTGQKKNTITVLQAVNTDRLVSYPCYKAAKILLPNEDGDLEPLLHILRTWREAVVASCRAK